MMRAYYDMSQKDRFEQRFGNLWIGKHPTKLQGVYQVLYFDFSTAPQFNMMTGFSETEVCEMFQYYQQHGEIYLPHLKDLIDNMAFDGDWKPLFEFIAKAYRDNSAVRDAIEGERNLQGFFKAYLALASYYLVHPELEMNYGYCDFFLLPDKQRYPETKHSYIMELKYASRTATDAELEEQACEGRRQLEQYSRDKKVLAIGSGTTLHCILLQFKGWDRVKCEEMKC